MLHVHYRPNERSPFKRSSDHAPRANSRLVVICLRMSASEETSLRAVHHRRVECELRPTLPRGPRQDFARAELFHAGRARRRLHLGPLDCGAERRWKCCFMPSPQKMCPQAASVAGRRGRHSQIEHMRWVAMPPFTHFSSKPSSKLPELTSMHSSWFGREVEGSQGCGCAAACSLPIRSYSAFRIGLGYLQSVLTTRGSMLHNIFELIK